MENKEQIKARMIDKNELSIEQMKKIIELEIDKKDLLNKSLNESIYSYTNDYRIEYDYIDYSKAIQFIEFKISECYNLFGNLKNSKRIIYKRLIDDLDTMNKLYKCSSDIYSYKRNIEMQERILNIIECNK